MDYTIKKFIKKCILYMGGVLTTVSPLYAYFIKRYNNIESKMTHIVKSNDPIDIIFLSDESISNFQYLGITYTPEVDNAPRIIFHRSRDSYIKNYNEMKEESDWLEAYSRTNNILFINSSKKIPDFSTGHIFNYSSDYVKEMIMVLFGIISGDKFHIKGDLISIDHDKDGYIPTFMYGLFVYLYMNIYLIKRDRIYRRSSNIMNIKEVLKLMKKQNLNIGDLF